MLPSRDSEIGLHGKQTSCLAPVMQVEPGYADLQICFVYLDASTRLLGFFLTTPRIRVGKGQLHCGS
jgi:hypothetical protein